MLFLGKLISTTTVENSMKILYKDRMEIPCDPESPCTQHLSKRHKDIDCIKQILYHPVYNGTVYNSQDTNSTEMPARKQHVCLCVQKNTIQPLKMNGILLFTGKQVKMKDIVLRDAIYRKPCCKADTAVSCMLTFPYGRWTENQMLHF